MRSSCARTSCATSSAVQDHFTAAREGTTEIGLAVLATSMSIIAVFLPVAFMKGVIGRFFFQFGLTVAFAVLVSLFVSFTLDPMLSSRWHDPDIERAGKRRLINRALDRFNDGFERMAEGYKPVIAWALDHRKTVVLAAFAAFVAGVALFGILQTEFQPAMDQGEFITKFKSAPGSSIEETRGRLAEVLKALGEFQEVKYSYASIGAGDSDTVRDALVFVKLVPRQGTDDERHRIHPQGARAAGADPRRHPVAPGQPGCVHEGAGRRAPGRRHRHAQEIRGGPETRAVAACPGSSISRSPASTMCRSTG